MEGKIAIVDLGTNTFHLMIGEWDGHRYRIIFRDRVAVKIGMGGINQGLIWEEAIDRALVALQQFKKIIDQYAIRKSVLVLGTSALRSAINGREVADRILYETGLKVQIISGEEEARLIYEGVKESGALDDRMALVVDIGGGSVEFILATKNEVFWKQSFEIGAQRLLERFQQHDPILKSEVDAINFYLETALDPLIHQLKLQPPEVLVGSSGTFDTLSEIYCTEKGLPYHQDMPETPLTFDSFRKTFAQLLVSNRQQRLAIPGMIELRVDMIVVACCLINFLIDRTNFHDVRVSTYSLKEGAMAFFGKIFSNAK